MCECPVFYATTEGQTRRIAERVAKVLRERGVESRAIDVTGDDVAYIDWRRVRGVAAGASVHVGRHQRTMDAFIRQHRDQLATRPSLFFSVSMRAGSPKPVDQTAVQEFAHAYLTQVGWKPLYVAAVAGRLAYTQYNWIVRFMMKRIAKRHGAATDTSRDHEYTDWNQVTRLAAELATAIRGREADDNRHPSQASPRAGAAERRLYA